MQVGGELWRKDVLYQIMDGKNDSITKVLEQDPELKSWKCKQMGDECVPEFAHPQHQKKSLQPIECVSHFVCCLVSLALPFSRHVQMLRFHAAPRRGALSELCCFAFTP